MTELDKSHAAMSADENNDALRLQFYERLADTELFLLLSGEPIGEKIEPELFNIEDGQYVLVFDREERLAEFVGRAAPYAGLAGRALAQMLAGQGIGLAFNLQVAPSEMLIPSEAIEWLDSTISNAPQEAQARITNIAAPAGLPESVVLGLDRKLAIAGGLARFAYIAAATYEGGARGHVLAFIDAIPDAEKSLAAAAGEALTFSGIEAGTLDVMFIASSDQMAGHLAKVGLRFDLPESKATAAAPGGPGMNPEKPPRLR